MAKVKKNAKKKAKAKAKVMKKAEENVKTALWAEPVGAEGTKILMLYQAVVAIILIALTIGLLRKIWQETKGAGSSDVWLILLVIVLGALGAQIRCIRSLSWYVGNRKLKQSWIPTYLLSPLVGSMLALVFFLLVRGGLLAMNPDMKTPSQIGLAGASALVGMFSDEAALKFKAIAGAIFSNAEKGKDDAKDKDPDEQ